MTAEEELDNIPSSENIGDDIRDIPGPPIEVPERLPIKLEYCVGSDRMVEKSIS